MTKRTLGRTDIAIDPVMLGGNVFGWTADKDASFAVLDAFVAQGFTAIDTADVYSRWIEGHSGGESETVIGEWLAARGHRDRLVIATKVGSDMGEGRVGLSAAYIERAVEDSLRRLKTDYIDLYQSHRPDANTAQEETLRAYERLVASGKVRAIGSSNFDAAQMAEALEISKSHGWPRYETTQPEYNLYTRDVYEGPLQDLCVAEEIGCIPYYGLASGFLTGKYRSEADFSKSPRGGRMTRYLNDRGHAILAALDAVSERVGATQAEVAIAWIIAQPGIAAPIASATSVAQVESLARGARLHLSADDLDALTKAGL